VESKKYWRELDLSKATLYFLCYCLRVLTFSIQLFTDLGIIILILPYLEIFYILLVSTTILLFSVHMCAKFYKPLITDACSKISFLNKELFLPPISLSFLIHHFFKYNV